MGLLKALFVVYFAGHHAQLLVRQRQALVFLNDLKAGVRCWVMCGVRVSCYLFEVSEGSRVLSGRREQRQQPHRLLMLKTHAIVHAVHPHGGSGLHEGVTASAVLVHAKTELITAQTVLISTQKQY